MYDDLCQKQHKGYAHHLKAISKALELEPQSEYLKDWQALLLSAIEHKKQPGRKEPEAGRDPAQDRLWQQNQKRSRHLAGTRFSRGHG